MPDQNKFTRVLTAVLLIQAALFYSTYRRDKVPLVRPLSGFPREISGWRMVREGYVDDETQAALRADDTLTRWYGNLHSRAIPSLFVAFFKTQRTGKTPHSPKNCLPGAGWESSREDYLDIAVPKLAQPIRVNRYVVSKGEDRSVDDRRHSWLHYLLWGRYRARPAGRCGN